MTEKDIYKQTLIINLSLPSKRESSNVKRFWIPAFAEILRIPFILRHGSLMLFLQIPIPLLTSEAVKKFSYSGVWGY
jgi:hypothetical protein